MRPQGNRSQEQEAIGHQRPGTRGYREKGPGTGGYRAAEARNRRLYSNRSQEQEAKGHQTAGTGDPSAAKAGEEDIGLWRAGTGGYRAAC